jgi:hypothetical protein
MIQNKVMRINEYEDGDSYWRIACDCSSPEHDIGLWFNANADDKQCGVINLNLSMEIGARDSVGYNFNHWWDPITRFIDTAKWRIATASKILFIGHYTMTGDVILDLDGIQAMQTALLEGTAHARKHI